MPAPKFRMRGTTSASETEATQKKTSTAPKFRMRGAGGGTSPSLPTATSQTAGETTGKKKAGRPTAGGKLSKITSPEREAESRAEELRTLRDEAHQEFLNFRGAEITAGATGMPTEPYAGQRYRTAEEAYQAWQDYDRQYAEFRNQYYQEENERQQARLAGDTAMQASFARADEIRAALNRIQSLEQTRAAAPGPMTEDAVSQAVREIAGEYGLSQEDGRNLTTVRKALESRLLEETDRISAAGYDYERMTEYQKRQERAAEAEQQRRQTAAWAGEHPVLASIASVGASALQAVDIPRLIATGGGSEDDLRTYTPADPNAAIISNFVTGVRDTVSKKIEENTDWELFGQNVASFLYNTGMSIGDSASQVALLGPWATYLMGASAASQQAVNVLERGGSNSQAFWGGLAAGAAEAVFERFSIEKLLEAKTINSVKDLLRETAKQAGTEASEEMLTEVANILSDTAIMGESSDFEQLVTQYQLMGMNEDEARKQAYLDSVVQVVWAGVGGALSGMAMGGATSGVDLAGRNIRQGIRDYQTSPIDDAYAVMQKDGMFSPYARAAAQEADRRRGVTEAVDRAAWMSDRWNRKARRDYLKNRGSARGEQELPTTSQQAQSPQATQEAPAGTQNAAPEGAAQELDGFTAKEAENLLASAKNKVVGFGTTIRDFVRNAVNSRSSNERLYLGKIPESTVQKVREETGLDISGFSSIMNGGEVRHALKNHAQTDTEAARGQVGITEEDFERLPEILADPDSVRLSEKRDSAGRPAIIFTKKIGDRYVTVQGYSQGKQGLIFDTMWANKEKPPATVSAVQAPPDLTSETSSGTAPANTVPQSGTGVNRPQAAPIDYDMAEEGAKIVRWFKEKFDYNPPLKDIVEYARSQDRTAYPKVMEAIRAGFVKAGKRKGGLYVVRETRPQTEAAENTDQQPETAERTEQNGQQGAETGDGVSDGDLGRLSGTGAGEQTGGVGTGAERGRGPTDTFRTARERQNSVHDLRGEPVSSRDLGLRRGTDAKTLQVIPESAWDDGLRATADRVRDETGLETVFVVGGIQIGTPDGARLVRGAYTGDRIIVQADNIRATTDQIADHEIFHDRAAQTPGLIRELEDRVREQYGPEELGRVVEQYIRKLRGVITVTENAGEDGVQAEAWAVLEEIFADAYAGINAFSAHAERFNETVEQTMAERGVGRGSQNAAATDRTTGPPEGRYSVDEDAAAEPSPEAQGEADRLFFQGVDADTIREMTGLERTEDGDWRFAVDTAPAAAYDGGRTTDQQGGTYNGQDTTLRGIYGEDVRGETEEVYPGRTGRSGTSDARGGTTDEGRGRAAPASWARGRVIEGELDNGSEVERDAGGVLRAQNRRSEAMDTRVRGEGRQTNGGIQEEPGQRAGIPGWARGRVIDRPSQAAGIAADNAGRYGAGAFVVEDAVIKERNPNAWALTSGGNIYISDSVPAELADVVGYHEAVHAAKQQGADEYLEFLDRTDDFIDFGTERSQFVIELLSKERFSGKDYISLSDAERKTVLDELNALVWGFHKADPENAREQFADMFRDYDAYIADLDAAMESGAEPEVPGLSLPTLDDEDTRYSMDEDATAAPSDNPLTSPDQERRSDLHRPRGMSDEQYNRLNERWKNRPVDRRETLVPEGFDSIDDYTAALEAAAEERMRNRSREEFEGSDALKSLGIRIANSVGLYGNTKQLIENDRAAKSVRKEIKRAERRLQATDAEKNFASGVAAGIYGEADIPPSMDADTVMELADYYWAEKAVQNDLIREQRTKINRNLDERVRRLMDGVDDTKTKVPAAVIMRNRTPERNMRRIFGNAKGDEINDYLFRPTQDNEAERIRFINRMHNEVRTFKDRNGKDRRLNKEERALVQLVIEGRAAEDAVNAMERSRDIQNAAENIKNARKLAGNDDLAKRRQAEIDASVDEAREFNLGTDERRLAIQYSRWLETRERLEGADTTIIGNAVEKYRELFNQLYDAANDFLVAHGYEPIGFIRGYAPHLQSQETQERFNSALERMGINREIGKLPTSIAGRTKNFKPNMPWNGFFKNRNSQGEFLDPDIAEGFEKYVDSMSDVLYHTDDIMRTRAFVRYFRRTYAPEEIRNQLEQADALRYAQTDQQASFLRDKGKLSYTSAPTYEDVHQAMEQYVDEQYQTIENLTLYGDLAVFLDDYANNLANKQLFEDRAMEKSFGRTSLNAISRVHRAFARAQVSANLSSALNQGGQLPIILAENGTRNVAQALIELRSKDLKSWAAGSDFLTEKKGINYIVTSWKDRAITGAFKPLEIVDGIVSTLAVRSRYLKEVRAGKSAAEAMRLADRFGREVMASRAKGSVPLAFRSKDFLNQMVHMFQLEALNNWEHVIQDLGNRDFRETERTKGKRAAARSLAFILGKIILGAFLLNRLDEWLYGGTPAPFDFLGLAGNLFAGGLGLTQMDLLETLVDNGWERLTGERLFGTDAELKEFDAAAAFDDFVWNGINEIPFASNVASLLGVGDRTLPMPDFSRLVDLPKAISEDGLFSQEVLMQLVGLAGDVLPGGRQIEKSAQGLLALGQGGYYRGSGEDRRLQFPVEQDFWSIVRGTLFGRSALDESRDFYASGQTGLSANQTKAYEQIVDMGADPETVYQAIQGWRAAENDEDLTSYGRNVAKRDAITEADLTDEQKLALYRGLSDADSSTPDHFREMMDTGLSWEEVMEAYDQYQFLNSDEDVPEADRLSATEKATEFASWVERQNYTEDQAETVKEALRYWQMIPAEASQKVQVADEYGISNRSRDAVSDEIDRLKGDGNSVTQDLAKEAIRNVPGLDNRERAILWQLQNKSWKWSKNPFDKRVGREVYDRMHEEDEN